MDELIEWLEGLTPNDGAYSPYEWERFQAAAQALRRFQWQPIESAPKDGGGVDLWVDGQRVADCFCNAEGDWLFHSPTEFSDFPLDVFYGEPTHWMPLPEPPSITEATSGVSGDGL